MMKTAAVMLAIAFGPSAFCVDGIKLINQATVMAAGGFPFVISQSGSYKLSGNLTMNTTSTGNYRNSNGAYDIGIAISASGVVLDLNGFSITVTNANDSISHYFYAIADLAAYHHIAIRNGTVSVVNTAGLSDLRWGTGISLRGASFSVFEDLRVFAGYIRPGVGLLGVSTAMRIGPSALIRHNVIEGWLSLDCASGKSLIIENIYVGVQGSMSACKFVHNTN